MVVKSAAEVVVGCALPFNVEMRQPRTSKSDSCGHLGPYLLDFECFFLCIPRVGIGRLVREFSSYRHMPRCNISSHSVPHSCKPDVRIY